MTKIIGITGGIGTGKSTVSSYLRQKGYRVLDADEMARGISQKEEVLKEVIESFGDDFVIDGKLNREKMAEEIFSNAEKKEILESIITNRIIVSAKDIFNRIRSEDKEQFVFFDAPTLIESGASVLVDKILLVTADIDIRLKRVSDRDRCDEKAVLDRIGNQMADEEKRKASDYVIDNSKDEEKLYKEIESFLKNIE